MWDSLKVPNFNSLNVTLLCGLFANFTMSSYFSFYIVDKMAIDDTQCENGLENGNGHLNGSLNGSLNGHLDGMNGETPVNGHNGHNDENGYSEMNGKKLGIHIFLFY